MFDPLLETISGLLKKLPSRVKELSRCFLDDTELASAVLVVPIVYSIHAGRRNVGRKLVSIRVTSLTPFDPSGLDALISCVFGELLGNRLRLSSTPALSLRSSLKLDGQYDFSTKRMPQKLL